MGAPANVQLVLAWLRYGVERLGWPGLLGLVLGGAAATLWLAVVIPLEADTAEQRANIVALRARLEAQPETGIVPAAEARKLAGLPGGNALLPLVAAVHAGARQHRIVLELGEYVWQRESGNRPARYRMIFPARGNYANLRGWTTVLLAAQPELVLEEFDLRRENIGSETLDARVQFSVRLEGKT
jgi:hypothetical protein